MTQNGVIINRFIYRWN